MMAARILVAEDEFLVWLVLEDELSRAGFDVVGPFASAKPKLRSRASNSIWRCSTST